METAIVVAGSAAIFLAMIMHLALKPKQMLQVTGYCVVIAAAVGFLMYGYGFACLSDNLLVAAVRTLYTMCRMFTGVNEIGEIKRAPLYVEYPWLLGFLWVAHVMAFYAMASAVITLIGTRLIRQLRRLRARRRDLVIIYATHDDAVTFGKQLSGNESRSIIFTGKSRPERDEKIAAFGALSLTDDDAGKATMTFFRDYAIGRGGRKVTLYAIDLDTAANLSYAQKFLASAEKAGIDPARMRLVLLSEDQMSGERLQAGEDVYGFGYVSVYDRYELSARLMTYHYPAAATMRFLPDGRADEDFEVLVVGFGRMGQEALRRLIMHGQFEGSRFRALICAVDAENMSGNFFYRYPELMRQYDISFLSFDARSRSMYDWLLKHKRSLNYVVVATGDDKVNAELEMELSVYLSDIGSEAQILQCAPEGIRRFDRVRRTFDEDTIFSAEILEGEKLDRMSMVANEVYDTSTDKTGEQKWRGLDYFSRMSCRAFADAIPEFLHQAGIADDPSKAAEVLGTEPLLTNLGKTEHLRWCAFHYCMGYRMMEKEMFEERAASYSKEVASKGESTIRIGKDPASRRHACLIPWDELPFLSEKEGRVTGTAPDYRQLDINNILSIPAILGQ